MPTGATTALESAGLRRVCGAATLVSVALVGAPIHCSKRQRSRLCSPTPRTRHPSQALSPPIFYTIQSRTLIADKADELMQLALPTQLVDFRRLVRDGAKWMHEEVISGLVSRGWKHEKAAAVVARPSLPPWSAPGLDAGCDATVSFQGAYGTLDHPFLASPWNTSSYTTASASLIGPPAAPDHFLVNSKVR